MPRRRSTGDANIPPERLAAFAVLARDHRGDLARIVEKPTPAQLEQAGPGRLVSMNCWRFAPSIFAACRAVTPSVRGELEIVDAVAALVAAGERMRVVGVAAGVLDLSARGDVRSTAVADPVDLSPGDDLAGVRTHPRWVEEVGDDPVRWASYLAAVENGTGFGSSPGVGGVGTRGGSEDHTAMLCSQPGHLGRFGFDPLERLEHVALPLGRTFVVGVSGAWPQQAAAASAHVTAPAGPAHPLPDSWQGN